MTNIVCRLYFFRMCHTFNFCRPLFTNVSSSHGFSEKWIMKVAKSETVYKHWCLRIQSFRSFMSSCLYRKSNGLEAGIYNLEETTNGVKDSDNFEQDDLNDENEPKLIGRLFRIPGDGHNVLVIQPKMKMLSRRNFNTTVELQLAESVTLIETLPGWKVVEKHIMNCHSPGKKHVFNSGNFATLKKLVDKNKTVTAVFLGLNILSGLQHAELEKELGMAVYDRYSIVLQIFLDHARTRDAKLQVALAEIPYLRSRLRHFHDTHQSRSNNDMMHVGGSGETFFQKRKQILFERELKIKRHLEKLRKSRFLLRQGRRKSELPVVAVVGYTNAGKTSLIKILTNDEKMEPKDQLFATLDVTAHATPPVGFQKTIYLDTIGFISDIPTALIASFSATLEDIAHADLIIHIMDLNHPDRVSQKETVLTTLKSLKLPQKLTDNIIEVGNKIDLLEIMPDMNGTIPVSSTKGTGIADLRKVIEEKILEGAGQLTTTLRVPTGGEACSWLYKVAGLRRIEPDPNNGNFLLMDVVLSHGNLAKFKHHFGDLEVGNNKR